MHDFFKIIADFTESALCGIAKNKFDSNVHKEFEQLCRECSWWAMELF